MVSFAFAQFLFVLAAAGLIDDDEIARLASLEAQR